jgi:hypothetical protein
MSTDTGTNIIYIMYFIIAKHSLIVVKRFEISNVCFLWLFSDSVQDYTSMTRLGEKLVFFSKPAKHESCSIGRGKT